VPMSPMTPHINPPIFRNIGTVAPGVPNRKQTNVRIQLRH
jgi:hypothetical protein